MSIPRTSPFDLSLGAMVDMPLRDPAPDRDRGTSPPRQYQHAVSMLRDMEMDLRSRGYVRGLDPETFLQVLLGLQIGMEDTINRIYAIERNLHRSAGDPYLAALERRVRELEETIDLLNNAP